MNRRASLIIAAAVAVFLVVGGVIVARSITGGGQARTINLSVNGSTMTPDAPSAHQGDRITMSVVTDKAEEIHLHGYDIVFHGEPGKTVTKSFTADKSGTFEIEIESSGTKLGNFSVNP